MTEAPHSSSVKCCVCVCETPAPRVWLSPPLVCSDNNLLCSTPERYHGTPKPKALTFWGNNTGSQKLLVLSVYSQRYQMHEVSVWCAVVCSLCCAFLGS